LSKALQPDPLYLLEETNLSFWTTTTTTVTAELEGSLTRTGVVAVVDVFIIILV
jgi:hypothetical protein